MKQYLYIIGILIGLLLGSTTVSYGQGDRGGTGSFSLSNLSKSKKEIPDSLLLGDTINQGNQLKAYRLTPYSGDVYRAPLDTNRLNFSNSTLGEGHGISVAYLANIGSPSQSRIFNERKEARDFIFADPFDYYITTPENAYFYDTKIPYTNITYLKSGSDQSKEDRLKGVLTVNFGRKINIGGDLDYIYSRGYYNSNGNKLLSYRLFGNYLSDKYEMRAFVSNFNFIRYENGGLLNDSTITHPDDFNVDKKNMQSKDYPVRYTNVFNRVRGKQLFLTHRYNLGFYRSLEEEDEEGNEIEVYVPVSSIVHTLHYEDNRRHFYTANAADIDTLYQLPSKPTNTNLDDTPSTWNLKNTFALSLREGFQDWVKFGLTAFVRFEKRKFKMASYPPENDEPVLYTPHVIYDEFSTYLGGELSKRLGSLLTYNASGELCIVGDDVGEFRLNGEAQTNFRLLGKDATVRAEGYVKNLTPAFFARHYSSRYFSWGQNSSLRKERQVYAGGVIDLQSTGTRISAGVTNLKNHVYFDRSGNPTQSGDNIQVITARIKQDLRYRAFGWENEAVYQYTSKKDVLPLPEISVYSNMYLAFRIVKVLSCQIGADVHYFTEYKAPYYEPATQQFQLQQEGREEVKVGNFPLINAYLNLHLKQARFFITAYNLGSKFVEPNYFSLAHYPLNPFTLRFGISVMFNN